MFQDRARSGTRCRTLLGRRSDSKSDSGKLGSGSAFVPRAFSYFVGVCALLWSAHFENVPPCVSRQNDRNLEFSVHLNHKSASSMSVAVGASSLSSLVTPEALENAAKEVDRQLAADRQFPELSEQINASQSK